MIAMHSFEEVKQESDHIHVLILENTRRLRVLEVQQAKFGDRVDSQIINEISDIKGCLQLLYQKEGLLSKLHLCYVKVRICEERLGEVTCEMRKIESTFLPNIYTWYHNKDDFYASRLIDGEILFEAEKAEEYLSFVATRDKNLNNLQSYIVRSKHLYSNIGR
jgi:hypothetical protein